MRKAYQALFTALEHNDLDALKLAMGRKAIHTWTDEDGEGPVHWACGTGTAAQLSLLLERPGADLEARGKRRRYTPMHIAAMFGDVDKVRVLLDAGASLHRPRGPMDPDRSYLDVCNSAATVRLLVARGLPVDRPGLRGGSPLYWAAAGGYLEVVNALLDLGADPGRTSSHGLTPLHGAARFHGGDAPTIIGRLLALGMDPNLTDRDGNTAEDLARLANVPDNVAVFERWREAQALRAVIELERQEDRMPPVEERARRRF